MGDEDPVPQSGCCGCRASALAGDGSPSRRTSWPTPQRDLIFSPFREVIQTTAPPAPNKTPLPPPWSVTSRCGPTAGVNLLPPDLAWPGRDARDGTHSPLSASLQRWHSAGLSDSGSVTVAARNSCFLGLWFCCQNGSGLKLCV